MAGEWLVGGGVRACQCSHVRCAADAGLVRRRLPGWPEPVSSRHNVGLLWRCMCVAQQLRNKLLRSSCC